MPIISQFYGIVIKMFFHDEAKHHKEHIHVEYGEFEASFDFEGYQLSGNLPAKQKSLVKAWILIHQNELSALWKLINEDGKYFKIDPLH